MNLLKYIFVIAYIIFPTVFAQTNIRQSSKISGDANFKKISEHVKTEFLHAWNGYKKYAWGHDDLKPLSRTSHDWYKESLCMSMVDAYDTMLLMGLTEEADSTKAYIIKHLSFDKDIYVKNFEITIRLLGGLLSGYQLSGDGKLLDLAKDLGKRLLPVFNSPTGMPYTYVNLKTGLVKEPNTNPAEIGTLLIEFGTLSKLSGDSVYYKKAKNALVELFKRRSEIGLVGTGINVETGLWTDTESHISGCIDSYFEYLLKSSILFNDKDCKEMWNKSIVSVNRYLADNSNGELWYRYADMNTGKMMRTYYGALDAFFPAVLSLSGDIKRAEKLQKSSFKMWNMYSIEPEVFDYKTGQVKYSGYPLRPEIIESAYYLYSFTRDNKYRNMGLKIWKDFVKYCRTEEAYASLGDVISKKKSDSMESFLFAETFKYFYLLFDTENVLDFNNVIFNTEAHPVFRNQNRK